MWTKCVCEGVCPTVFSESVIFFWLPTWTSHVDTSSYSISHCGFGICHFFLCLVAHKDFPCRWLQTTDVKIPHKAFWLWTGKWNVSLLVGALKSIYEMKCALLDKIANFGTQIVEIFLYRNFDGSKLVRPVFGRHLGFKNGRHLGPMVSPPQMPVPLKYM